MTILKLLPIEFEHFLPCFLFLVFVANDDLKITPYLHWTDSGFSPHEYTP